MSVIMPVCAWPDPGDDGGAPHPFLLRSLESAMTSVTPSALQLVVLVDGNAMRVHDAVARWLDDTHVEYVLRCCERRPGTWGNRQRNHALDHQLATRSLIAWQDQDDAFFPGALTHVLDEARAHPGQPLIFRMQVCADRFGSLPFVLWRERGRVERNHIGGHMLVAPNVPRLLGRWEPETSYSADFDFIDSTLKKFAADGIHPHWSEHFISNLRPDAMR